MSELDKQAIWDLLREEYLLAYQDKSHEEILAQLAFAHQENARLTERVAYLYKHARDNVRDLDPKRNAKIADYVNRGVSDKSISKYLVDDASPKVVEKVRLAMKVTKPRGRPKKPS